MNGNRLHITIPDHFECVVEFYNHSFMKDFIPSLKVNLSKNKSIAGTTRLLKEILPKESSSHYLEALKKVYSNILTLQKLGVPWPIQIPDHPKQTHLNLLHRFFTTACTTLDTMNPFNTSCLEWGHPFLESQDDLINFKKEGRGILETRNQLSQGLWNCLFDKANFTWEPTLGFHEYYRHLEAVNMNIHLIEDYTETSHRRLVDKIFGSAELTRVLNVIFERPTTQLICDKDVFPFRSKWYQECSLKPGQVYLLKGILGKDYVQCFADEDDPRHIDITNIDRWYEAGLTIDPHRAMETIWHSTQFRQWLDFYKIPFTPEIVGVIPVGKLVYSEGTVSNKLDRDKIQINMPDMSIV